MRKFVVVFWMLSLAVSGCGVTLDLPNANVDHWGLTGTDKVNAALNALNAGKVEWRGSVTEAERDALSSPTVGDLIYNETAGEFESYDGSAWGVMGGDMTGAELEAALDAYFGSSAWRTQDGTGTDDQTASEVPVADVGGFLAASDVEAALAELAAEIDANTAILASVAALETQLSVDFVLAAELNSEAALEAFLGGVNIMTEAEVDAKIAAIDSVNLEQDLAALTADNTATGTVYSGENAGENIAQWTAVYFDSTAGEMMNCEPTSFAEMDFEGLAYAASTDGNPISLVNDGFARHDAWNWSAKGVDIYVIAGGVLTETKPTTAGHYYARIARSTGAANFADTIKFYKTVVVFQVPNP